jgi:hypothetical protein
VQVVFGRLLIINNISIVAKKSMTNRVFIFVVIVLCLANITKNMSAYDEDEEYALLQNDLRNVRDIVAMTNEMINKQKPALDLIEPVEKEENDTSCCLFSIVKALMRRLY